MNQDITKAFQTGYERLATWADLIDSINVFPVADGDTGRNLVLSLAPVRHMNQKDPREVTDSLLMSARGMSGNITTRFLSAFLHACRLNDLLRMAVLGRDQAWQAVDNPKPGTVLSVFDALCEALEAYSWDHDSRWTDKVILHLERTVSDTSEQLSELKAAGVVDSGALGMFIFFDGFFSSLSGGDDGFRLITEVFRDKLTIRDACRMETGSGYCIDLVLGGVADSARVANRVKRLGKSVVTFSHGDYLKAHLHTDDRGLLHQKIEDLGDLVQWSSDDLVEQTRNFRQSRIDQALHIVTDAAGSVTRQDAVQQGITLLDSYVNLGEKSLPESYVTPEDLYGAMRTGIPVSTSQASVFERHQQYDKLLRLYPQALYLCVGSAYTGNYQVVTSWKQTHDTEDRLTVIDTGLASGRLGLVAIATARYSMRAQEAREVIDFARQGLCSCREYIFLDKLRYLAAGGRVSKTSSFFGDLLHMKPVITPTPEGAKKVTALRNRKEQLAFLMDKVEEVLADNELATFLLEYTDTREFVEEAVLSGLQKLCPNAEFMVRPLSITSGAHMGPGTWAVAFLPKTD
jgi:DegV family protein with EDD domain